MAKFDSIMVNVDIGTSRKFARFTPAERWCIVAGVWALAGKSPIRGYLLLTECVPLTDDDIADQAGVTVAVVRSTLRKMRDLGMLERDANLGAEHVHDWHEHQPEPKASDSRAAWRERKRAQRERDQPSYVTPIVTRDGHGDVTPDGPAPEEKEREGKEEPPQPPTASGGGSTHLPRGSRGNGTNPRALAVAGSRIVLLPPADEDGQRMEKLHTGLRSAVADEGQYEMWLAPLQAFGRDGDVLVLDLPESLRGRVGTGGLRRALDACAERAGFPVRLRTDNDVIEQGAIA